MDETCLEFSREFYCANSSEICGQWECEGENEDESGSFEDGTKCFAKCLNDDSSQSDSGKRECSCYVQFGPIRILRSDGCQWKTLETPICSSLQPTSSTTSTTTTKVSTTITITTVSTSSPVSTSASESTTSSELELESSYVCGSDELETVGVNGQWYCNTETIFNGSICKLKCLPGFIDSQPLMKRRCRCKNGKCGWTRTDISCLIPGQQGHVTKPTNLSKRTCKEESMNDDNGYWKCSNQFYSGSKCNLLCFAGFDQIKTRRRCKCTEKSCKWKGTGLPTVILYYSLNMSHSCMTNP